MSPANLVALTRSVSAQMGDCELTHLQRAPIDVERAREQHAQYERALARLGCRVIQLASADLMPDSVFIEDTAVVLDELAVMTRPGAESRRAEIDAVAGVLWMHRPLAYIEPPGTVDGGDVLVAGRTIFVGRSARTNEAGIAQLTRLWARLGYTVRPVDVRGCLHLKSAATAIGDAQLLVNAAWIDPVQLAPLELVEVDPEEPGAANIVRVGDNLLAASAFPRTRERLERRGRVVSTVDVSEIAKAEGAVTCCSLIFRANRETPFAV